MISVEMGPQFVPEIIGHDIADGFPYPALDNRGGVSLTDVNRSVHKGHHVLDEMPEYRILVADLP